MKNKRNDLIDIIKGIGIFLVVLGHQNTTLTQEIYSFHMPLFFFMSGIFHKNYSSYIEFIKRKIKTLMVPYFIFAISLFLFWFFISRNFGESNKIKVSILENFMGIFIGAEIKNISQIGWGATLWFLPCLFLVSNIYYFLNKLSIKKIIGINFILIIIAYFLLKLNIKYLNIWHFLTALFSVPFYSVGKILKDEIISEKVFNSEIIFILFFINIIVSKFNGKIDINMNIYNNLIMFYISAFSGILFLIFAIKKIKLKNKVIDFLGKNTLIIFAYHLRVNIIITILLTYILKLNLSDNLIIGIVLSIFQIILCLPLVYIFNRYLPFLMGKIKEQNRRKII